MKITNFPKPNYKAWDQINIFDHLQVTCLWADFEPSIKASRQEICYAIHKLLEEARMEGFLRSDVVKEYINGKLQYNVIFYRKDLIAYAEWKDVKPAFLYPETRTDADGSIRTDSSSPPNPAALPSKAKVEDLSDSAVELPKIEDVQEVQGQSSENEQPVISEHEYPEEICDLFDLLSKAKTEDPPDIAIELPKEEVVQKVQGQSNENERPVISEHEYPKEICDLFALLSKAKVENQPDSAVELSKNEDAQKTQSQSQSSENEQLVISEHEYPEEICDLFDLLSKAKTEDLPDTAAEPSKIEDVQKTQSQSSENEQPVVTQHGYPKEFCDLFPPLSKSAILLLFSMHKDKLDRAIDRSSRNGLKEARVGRGRYNPAKIAFWLIQRGLTTHSQADVLLRKALPLQKNRDFIANDYFRGNEIG